MPGRVYSPLPPAVANRRLSPHPVSVCSPHHHHTRCISFSLNPSEPHAGPAGAAAAVGDRVVDTPNLWPSNQRAALRSLTFHVVKTAASCTLICTCAAAASATPVGIDRTSDQIGGERRNESCSGGPPKPPPLQDLIIPVV